jgi:hypothetical protein
MSIIEQGNIDPQAVRSRARGKGFLIPLVAAWPVGVLGGLVATFFGVGMAGALGTGLAVALGLNFVWVVIAFAIDDGEVDERAREAAAHEEADSSTPRASVRHQKESVRPAGH